MSETHMGEMFQYWSKTQSKWIEDWLGAAQNLGTAPASQWWQEEYKRCVDASERLVKKAIVTQAEFARTWADNISKSEATPPLFNHLAQQTQQSAEEYVGLQNKFWDMWFSTARNIEMPGFFGAQAAESTDDTTRGAVPTALKVARKGAAA
jgi:hypothetical protein